MTRPFFAAQFNEQILKSYTRIIANGNKEGQHLPKSYRADAQIEATTFNPQSHRVAFSRPSYTPKAIYEIRANNGESATHGWAAIEIKRFKDDIARYDLNKNSLYLAENLLSHSLSKVGKILPRKKTQYTLATSRAIAKSIRRSRAIGIPQCFEKYWIL